MKVHGRCHCGGITYEAEVDPARVSACHCTDCQVLSGSAYRVSVPAPRETFRMSGTPATYLKTAESGNKRVQAFCPQCGTPIYSSATVDPPMYSLRVGTLDERAQLPPQRQIWCRSALDWAMDIHELPKVERQ
jgi:hypothetical protein